MVTKISFDNSLRLPGPPVCSVLMKLLCLMKLLPRRRELMDTWGKSVIQTVIYLYRENLKSQNPNLFLVRILEYLETPQYLRKLLFPIHKDLQFAGLLNPLDCPHHMRQEDQAPYREGVVLDRPPNTKKGRGSYVNVGTKQVAVIDVIAHLMNNRNTISLHTVSILW